MKYRIAKRRKDGVRQRYWVGRKKNRRSDFIYITSPEFKDKVGLHRRKYGEAKVVSGKSVGTAMAAIGAIPGLPSPILVPVGLVIRKKVDNVRITRDKGRLPGIIIQTKNRRFMPTRAYEKYKEELWEQEYKPKNGNELDEFKARQELLEELSPSIKKQAGYRLINRGDWTDLGIVSPSLLKKEKDLIKHIKEHQDGQPTLEQARMLRLWDKLLRN